MQLAIEGKIMHTQHCVQNKRLDLYFSEQKLGIEIDEYDHEGRNSEYEQSRQLMIEEKLGCVFIRTNPDAPDFDIYRLINQVHLHIKQSTVKSTRNSLIDDLSKELSEAAIEFKSKYKEVKAKLIKNIVKNVLSNYKKCKLQNRKYGQ